ncbi:alpha/beta fold hydrolase [Corynebacterium sp. 13CS0277]|uniref:alpha/beta fold hydrolase n=1 Tax=Corynebacterium sp. 13CS0277 TaxID=2071994 RepID=UPI001304988B|nr:alpha/beta hydrolase [Corynebacterium sp. 13CS0277]
MTPSSHDHTPRPTPAPQPAPPAEQPKEFPQAAPSSDMAAASPPSASTAPQASEDSATPVQPKDSWGRLVERSEEGVSYLLIGGLGVQPAAWSKLMSFMPGAHIAPATRAVFVDKDAPLADFDYELKSLSQLMQKLPGKVVLVGHSMGALLAEGLARTFPEKTCALVLVDGSTPTRVQHEAYASAQRVALAQAATAAGATGAGGSAAGDGSAGVEGADSTFGAAAARAALLASQVHVQPGTVQRTWWRVRQVARGLLVDLPAPIGKAVMRLVGRIQGMSAADADIAAQPFGRQRAWWQLVLELRRSDDWVAHLTRIAEIAPLQVPVTVVVATGRTRWARMRNRRWIRNHKAFAEALPTTAPDGSLLPHRHVELNHADHMVMLSAPRELRDLLRTAATRPNNTGTGRAGRRGHRGHRGR